MFQPGGEQHQPRRHPSFLLLLRVHHPSHADRYPQGATERLSQPNKSHKSCSVDLRLPIWFAGSEHFPISSGGSVPAPLPSFEASRSADPGSSLVSCLNKVPRQIVGHLWSGVIYYWRSRCQKLELSWRQSLSSALARQTRLSPCQTCTSKWLFGTKSWESINMVGFVLNICKRRLWDLSLLICI